MRLVKLGRRFARISGPLSTFVHIKIVSPRVSKPSAAGDLVTMQSRIRKGLGLQPRSGVFVAVWRRRSALDFVVHAHRRNSTAAISRPTYRLPCQGLKELRTAQDRCGLLRQHPGVRPGVALPEDRQRHPARFARDAFHMAPARGDPARAPARMRARGAYPSLQRPEHRLSEYSYKRAGQRRLECFTLADIGIAQSLLRLVQLFSRFGIATCLFKLNKSCRAA